VSARVLRVHLGDGRVLTEPLTSTARANGLRNLTEARALVEEWVHRGDLERRPDGGYDVKRHRPRPDRERVAQMRARAFVTDPAEPAQ
jgi:hypothetical protein